MSIYDQNVMFHLRRRYGLRWKRHFPSLSDICIEDWIMGLCIVIALLVIQGVAIADEGTQSAEDAANWQAISLALMNGDPIESDDGQWAGKCGYFQEATNGN